jgi:2-amino-4-hydroxy-6-hydroxymethyldihydropteridine diphosphokinase
MALVFLGLGSNEGNRLLFLLGALENIKRDIGVIQTQSSVYQTAPWGFHAENDFYNMVVAVLTNLSVEELLIACRKIEKKAGRHDKENKGGYQSRALDIDILMVDNLIINTPKITIPHKEMEKRNFVLVPLHEIAPGLVHPHLQKTIKELLESSQDTLAVRKIELPN